MADDVTVRLRWLGSGRFQSEASRSGKALHHIGESARGMGSSMRASLGSALALTGGLVGLGAAVKTIAAEYTEAAKVGAQTDAVLRSTKGAANVTRKQVEGLSQSLSYMAGVDDEAIQSGANLLLTFTKVRNEAGKGNDIFNQATAAAVDMAAALGTEPRRAAMQLGKALNSPIKGISALSRSGVAFTKSQKEQIRHLVATGHRLQAQKLMLRELATEFKGSAAAQATPMDHLRVATGNLAESLGTLAAPTVNKGIEAVSRFINGLQTGAGAGGAVAGMVKRIAGAVPAAAQGFKGQDRGMMTGMAGVFAKVGTIAGTAFRAVQGAAERLWDALKPAQPFLQNVLIPLFKGLAGGILGGVVTAFNIAVPIIGLLARALGWVGTKLAPFTGLITLLGGVLGFVFGGPILGAVQGVGRLAKVVRFIFGPVRTVTKAFSNFGRLVGGIFGRLPALIGRAVGGIFKTLGGLAGRLVRWGGAIIGHIARGIAGAPGAIKDALLRVLGGAIDAAPLPGVLKGKLKDWLGVDGMAAGGYVSSGGLKLVGEQGPELVSLPHGAYVTPNRSLRGAGGTFAPMAATAGAGGGEVHTHVYLNGREIARAVGQDTADRVARQ